MSRRDNPLKLQLNLIRPLRIAALVGCAFVFSGCAPMKPLQFYEGPELPGSKMVRIVHMDAYSATGNRLSYDWISYVVEVDGKSTEGYGISLLLPGKHKVKMVCEPHPKYEGRYSNPVREVVVEGKPGEYFYPWCSMEATVVRESILPSPLTGRHIGSVAAGRMLPYLSTQRVP